jgi:hypothetical protein
MFRQGDILLERIDRIPESAVKLKDVVIATGAVTGHQHKIRNRTSARLYLPGSGVPPSPGRRFPGELYLEVVKDQAQLAHPEHKPIVLTRGCYRVWRQREHGRGVVAD